MSIIKDSIGKDAYKIIEIARHLLNEPLMIRYKFCTKDEMEVAFCESPRLGNKIYWIEIFFRSHMSAYSGLKRLLDWVKIIEHSSDNFISYCSGLRGMMECVGDTYDGLSAVAITLGDNKNILKKAIKGNADQVIVNEELESKLIHFTHASKLYAKETGLNYHKPKHAKVYVEFLEKDSKIKFYDYYSFLCELAHPAGVSLGVNFEETLKGEMIFNPSRDNQLVSEALIRDKDLMIELLIKGFNPIFLIIKTINLFQIENMYSKYADKINLDNIPAWKRINK